MSDFTSPILLDDFNGKGLLATHAIAPINEPAATWEGALLFATPELDGEGAAEAQPIDDRAAVCNPSIYNGTVGGVFWMKEVAVGESAGLLVRYVDENNYVRVDLTNGLLMLREYINGQEETRVVEVEMLSGQPYPLRCHLADEWLTVWVGAELLIKYTLATNSQKASRCGLVMRAGSTHVYCERFWVEA